MFTVPVTWKVFHLIETVVPSVKVAPGLGDVTLINDEGLWDASFVPP